MIDPKINSVEEVKKKAIEDGMENFQKTILKK